MLKAAEAFAFELDKIVFKDSIYPVASNVDPEPSQDGIILKERLKEQMTKGVRWREIMDVISDSGINTLVEIGPGKVLSGLAKRSITGVSINQISSSSDLGY